MSNPTRVGQQFNPLPRPISNMIPQPYDIHSNGQMSPTQTQGTSNSATPTSSSHASSPVEPRTPPPRPRAVRGRTRDGETDRVPLHKRGMSKKFETLADVLAAEGYKETRIPTPENDDSDERAMERHGGMGAVVDFFSQIFPNARTTETEPTPSLYSSPPQSLATDDCDQEEATPRPSRYDSLATERLQKYYTAAPPDRLSSPSSVIAQPRPSRAGMLLRHMNSTATMAPLSRPNSTPAHAIRGLRDDDDDPSIIFSQKGNGEGEEEDRFPHHPPPLPQTWLESVTRALMSGGHVGGPLSPTDGPRKPSHPPHPLRTACSSMLSETSHKRPKTKRSGLTDQTNVPLPLGPPPLVTMIERGRAGRSESQVTRTRVVCRSAPGSRAPSLTRAEKARARGRRPAPRKGGDRVPSLARTQTEDDTWNNGQGLPSTANDVKARYLTGLATASTSGVDDADDDDSDDDDEPPNLTRILLPRRQHSIQSLRKHLTPSASAATLGGRSLRAGKPFRSPLHDDDDFQEDNGVWKRKIGEDEEQQATYARLGDARGNGARERGGMPLWAAR